MKMGEECPKNVRMHPKTVQEHMQFNGTSSWIRLTPETIARTHASSNG
jgi:hypothetical protein